MNKFIMLINDAKNIGKNKNYEIDFMLSNIKFVSYWWIATALIELFFSLIGIIIVVIMTIFYIGAINRHNNDIFNNIYLECKNDYEIINKIELIKKELRRRKIIVIVWLVLIPVFIFLVGVIMVIIVFATGK